MSGKSFERGETHNPSKKPTDNTSSSEESYLKTPETLTMTNSAEVPVTGDYPSRTE